MRIEYQLTPEDYSEVNRRHARFRPWVFIWAIGLLACISLISDLNPAPPQAPSATSVAATSPGLLRGIVLPLLPWLASLVVIWVIVFRALRTDWRKPWLRGSRPRGENRWFIAFAFALELAGIAFLFVMAVRAQRAVTTDPRELPVLDVLLSLVPWMLLTAFLGFMFHRFRGVFQRGWESQPHMHRPFVAEFDDDGVRLSEPLSRHEYRWDYFPGCMETEHLFVVYVSPVSFHVFPKRSFADDGARLAFAALPRRMISERTSAFPVLRATDVRPLPPLPVAE